MNMRLSDADCLDQVRPEERNAAWDVLRMCLGSLPFLGIQHGEFCDSFLGLGCACERRSKQASKPASKQESKERDDGSHCITSNCHRQMV